MAEAKSLTVGGVVFPIKYGGLTQSRSKIWSANTGRNNVGDMVGTILAVKNKFEIEFVPLSPKKADELDRIISDKNKPFQEASILYLDGTVKNVKGYFGDISYSWVGRKIGTDGLINGVKVSFIEQ